METVVFVMMVLVCWSYLLKQTCRKACFVALSAVACALFAGLTWPWAIEQSKSRIAEWLADTDLMLDVAVILTLDVLLQIAFCVMAAHMHTSGPVKRRTVAIYRMLRWFPGMLPYPVLFSASVAAIFAFPGVSFPLVAWCLAAVVAVAIPSGAWLLRRLLPEKEIRLELLFLTNVLIAILGVITTVNGRTAVAAVSQVSWPALGGVSLLVAAGIACGAVAYRIKMGKSIKKT